MKEYLVIGTIKLENDTFEQYVIASGFDKLRQARKLVKDEAAANPPELWSYRVAKFID